METPEERAILDQFAICVAVSHAEMLGLKPITAVMINTYVEKLEFLFEIEAPAAQTNDIIKILAELGQWLVESVRWTVRGGNLVVGSIQLVRTRTL